MTRDDKARRLADHLQTVLEEADCCDRDNPALCERLSPQEVRVLRTVGGTECCVMSGIARAVRLSLSSVTGLIDRLTEKKLVRRDRSNDDRRVVQVELTAEGRELHQAAVDARAGFARELLSNLEPGEQDELLALLGKISSRLKEKRARA